jgi:uncharacterized protein
MKKKQKKIKRTTKSIKIEIRGGKPETRSYKSTRLEVRKSADGSMQLAGTAIVFDSPSQDLGGFTEICKYEAVQKSLQRNDDLYLLWQHDPSQPLSRVKTGLLQTILTRDGLNFVATLPNSPLGQNAYQAVKDGTVDSVSFGFNIEPGGDKWINTPDGRLIRELWDINVSELSPVTWAAYLAPHVDVRSCPASLRIKLKRSDDDVDTDDDSEDRCSCECESCEADECEDCTSDDPDYEDDNDCVDCGGALRQAHLELLLRRLKS